MVANIAQLFIAIAAELMKRSRSWQRLDPQADLLLERCGLAASLRGHAPKAKTYRVKNPRVMTCCLGQPPEAGRP